MRIRTLPDLLGFVNNVLYFTLPAERRTAVLALVERPQELEPVLAQPFTPGRLLRAIADGEMGLT